MPPANILYEPLEAEEMGPVLSGGTAIKLKY